MDFVIISLIAAALVFNVLLYINILRKKNSNNEIFFRDVLKQLREEVMAANNNANQNVQQVLTMNSNYSNALSKNISDNMENMRISLQEVTKTLDSRLERINRDTYKQLDDIRNVVDEKLNTTLEQRLNESFNVMHKRLESLQSGLGEMKTLAGDVVDLKKVMSNVKTRGTWGEVQLGALLSQMLAPEQYVAQAVIKTGCTVEFAVRMPGKDESILLPIDAKFPIEDYLRIVEASEIGDLVAMEECTKSLERRVLEEAKKISEKYINAPVTTDFAIMYLPTEGLYAEVLRRGSVFSEIQQKHKVTICGPTTLSALLNSLQMGFRSLAIEKRSSEVWKVLGIFKTEFSKFCGLLEQTQKKIHEAGNKIEYATKKTKTIQNKLRSVQLLNEPQSEQQTVEQLLLELNESDSDEEMG